jgi:hypothetical protein
MAQVRVTLREADGELPGVCMVCGQAASLTVPRTLSYCPGWINVTWILGGPPVYWLMAWIMTKHADVQTPLCDDHQRYWFKRRLITLTAVFFLILFGVAGFFAVVLLAAGQQNERLGYIGLAGGVVLFFIFVIIFGVIRRAAIRAGDINDHDLLLVNVCPEFVDAVEQGQAEEDEPRPRRKRRAADDDDEDEPRPKKKRRPRDNDDD